MASNVSRAYVACLLVVVVVVVAVAVAESKPASTWSDTVRTARATTEGQQQLQ